MDGLRNRYTEAMPKLDPPVIDDPKNLTPEWLTAVLRAAGHESTVRSIRCEPVGTGQMAHNERIFLDYEPGTTPGPATLVGKFPSPSEESRAAGAAGGYMAEVRFYTELARDLSIRVPECFYGALSEDGRTFTLLLEDMAPAVQGDQIEGASDDEIEATIRNLAGLHAPLWESPRLEQVQWAPLGLDASFAPVMQGATPAFIERYDDRLSEETKEVLLGFSQGFARWAETQPAEQTLVHGDFRLDNQLFGKIADGVVPVATVDWQTISTGSGGRDLAYMLGNACPPEQRRASEARMLETYRRSMAELGVERSEEEIRYAYRHGAFQGPFITILGSLAVGQTDRGDTMFMAMAERCAAQIRDLDSLALIS